MGQNEKQKHSWRIARSGFEKLNIRDLDPTERERFSTQWGPYSLVLSILQRGQSPRESCPRATTPGSPARVAEGPGLCSVELRRCGVLDLVSSLMKTRG